MKPITIVKIKKGRNEGDKGATQADKYDQSTLYTSMEISQ
jgi:hypothetical protein